MRKQIFNEIVKWCNLEDSCKKSAVLSIQSHSQRHFKLTHTDAVLDNIVHHSLVLLVLFSLAFTSAALNVSFDALIH